MFYLIHLIEHILWSGLFAHGLGKKRGGSQILIALILSTIDQLNHKVLSRVNIPLVCALLVLLSPVSLNRVIVTLQRHCR